MQAAALIDRLAANAAVFDAAFAGIGAQQAVWKPAPEHWSAVEVAAHLLDEEREDFRQRLRLTLASPDEDWPPIDPQGWVRSRRYAERDLAATVRELLAERTSSVEWLQGLVEPDWERAHPHPTLGAIRAGDLLVSWVAHDALHTRQLARLHFGWVGRLGEPYSPDYAGGW